jgi:hypothetical protein
MAAVFWRSCGAAQIELARPGAHIGHAAGHIAADDVRNPQQRCIMQYALTRM